MKQKMSDEFKTLVGPKRYDTFSEVLGEIGPDSRTERISIVITGFLRFALARAPSNPAEGSLAEGLVLLEEVSCTDNEDRRHSVLELVDEICRAAGMRNHRTTASGMEYSIADRVLSEYCRWYNMPWEE